MKTISIFTFILTINCAQNVISVSKNNSCYVNNLQIYKHIANYATFPYYKNNKTVKKIDLIIENSNFVKLCDLYETKHYDEKQYLNDETRENRNQYIKNNDNVLNYFFNPSNTLDINFSGINEKCKKQIHVYHSDLNNFNMWAMKMYDSSAKIPSGILNGNVNQYGDYDQCLAIRSNHKNPIKGKYCLASFQVDLLEHTNIEMRDIFDLIHSHYAFRSEMTDPGHRIPRFSSMNWGICMPNSCSSSDLQTILSNVISSNVNSSMVNVKVLVDAKMCQESKTQSIQNGTKVTILCFIVMGLIVVYATLHDDTDSIIANFSLKRTLFDLTSMKRGKDDIEAVHGIRFLNAIMLIISHKSMAIFFRPYMNRTEMAEDLGDIWSVMGRAASLYTDPFIMFSGLLTCYSILRKIDENKNVSVLKEYVSRFSRLIPTLIALILFCTWILPLIGSGPQWPLVIDHHSNICKKYWWRNFLFIHNYFGFENMCLTHTHHIGIDTQLFIIGVPLIIWMGLNKKYANHILSMLLILGIVSTFARFYISYTMNLANYVHFGASVQQLFRTADYMYILPSHRFTVYVMGIFLAVLVRNPPIQKLTKNELTIGWIISAVLFCAAFFGPSGMSCMNYEYNSFHNALYAAFAPIAWSASFAWIVYTTHHGYTSYIGRLFSWRIFIIWTRLSYAVYLTQFPVFFYNVGSIRTAGHFEFLGALLNGGEFIWIMILSVLMTVVFDLPFQKLKNIYLKDKVMTPSSDHSVPLSSKML